VKKRCKLKFATDDSSEKERELLKKNTKPKADAESASDGVDSESTESDVAIKRKSEKEKQ